MTEQEYRDLLASIIRYVTSHGGTREDARDIFQDALEATLEKINNGQYNDQGNIGGYIARIAQFKWIDKVRGPINKVLGEEHLPQGESIKRSYEDWLQQADASGTGLRHAISDNPKILSRFEVYLRWADTECQERLERTYIEGLTNIEQAQLENVRENTFTVRLKRCRDKFVEMYEKYVKGKI